MNIDRGRIMNDFIEPNKNQYAIPVYQRNYEWSKEQCVKLFQDIIYSSKNDTPHFCGSIVYKLLKQEHNISYYVVIDGQQRITTIYILLKALLDNAETALDKNLLTEALFNIDKYETYDVDTASKLKLKPIKSDNAQLALLMDNKYDSIDKSSGIWQNYELFSYLIKNELENGLTIRNIYYGLENLLCAKIKLDNENAQEIFDRINSTGVPLSLADKIRNFVLMTDVKQEQLYENYWLPIENLVKKDHITSFFLDYLNMKIDGFAKESDAYDEFKNLYSKDNYTNETMLNELLHYAKFYHAFLYGDGKYGVNVNDYLASLQKLKQTTVFLFLFKVFDDFEQNIIDLKTLEKICRFLLSYSIRRLICEVGSNSLRGLYKTLYTRIFIKQENKEHYYDAIISFFKQLNSKDAWIDDNEFKTALKENNLYRKNALCKYLLGSIENQGKTKIIIDNLTIEHILPQNKNLSSDWQSMLGENWIEIQNKYVHTLGNLTLTAYNSELGDKPFSTKNQMLSAANSQVVYLYKDVINCAKWDANTILSRAERLSSDIIVLYKIDEPKTIISFTDPRYKEYTCDDPDNATWKAPNYFVLQGERISADSFAEMLKTVIERLYELNPAIIENMAHNNEKILEWSQNILLSYDANMTSGQDLPIKDSGIYQSTGFSASHIIHIIRALLKKYEIPLEDFSYSARDCKPKS